ncbi:MAG: hypothetical protein KGI09_00735 [Thaumarchaeota archaeon]|nr:hypothetical protein [Nitrososphaerota archaeon]MDE1878208.1 hypothetical protein [Nitrososphaerota archaeon]
MKTLLILPALAAIVLLLPASAYAAGGGGAGATGSVTIAGTCGLALNTNSIAYGIVTPNQVANATNNPIVATNTGTVNATLVVSGGNWTSGSPVIYANYTFVSPSAIHPSQISPIGPHLSFTGAPVLLTNSLAPATPFATFWALWAHLVGPFAGNLSQTVTYTTAC